MEQTTHVISTSPTLWLRLVRWIRHRWQGETLPRDLDSEALKRLTHCVALGELRHNGQVRICIEGGLPWSYLRRGAAPRERAIALFGKLRVWDTEYNNGVLIYLLLADKSVEVVADRALAREVSPDIWQTLVKRMQVSLRAGRHEEALIMAVQEVSDLLEEHTSGARSDSNELPDAPALATFRS